MAWAKHEAPLPFEVEAGSLVNRFGAAAVFGNGLLGLKQMRDILLAENVAQAHQAEQRAERTEEGAAGWASRNPSAASLLAWAIKASSDQNPD